MGLCCVRREGSGMGVVVLNAMCRGVGTLGVFASGYLLVLRTPPALGHSTCGKRAVDFSEKELVRVEAW